MLVYGDVERRVSARAVQQRVGDLLAAAAAEPPSLARHALLVEALLLAGDLAGGTLDREFAARGADDVSDATTRGAHLVMAIARLVETSWRSAFGEFGGTDEAARRLAAFPATGTIVTKPTEGYAFYALYPELHAEAARAARLPPATRVIGIRSIGVSLAAMVAAALGAAPPVTLRPHGHPFRRTVRVAPELERALLAGDPPAFAIVDEGPGLSGSSFGAVADWLEEHGVARRRLHFFPGHANPPGPEASATQRARWDEVARHVVAFEVGLLPRLQRWVEDLVGPLDGPLRDISAGRWRALAGDPGAALPAAPGGERVKYLARRADQRWLVKFAGLGAEGRRKQERAQQLFAAGFGAEPVGLCHGFLVVRWVEGVPLPVAPADRPHLVARLGRYLAFRARLPAPDDAGASLARLCEMALYNTREALGSAAAAALLRQLPPPAALPARLARVEIDGRLHAWEWVHARDGRLIKTDALDHGHAHDVIGAQDIGWDIAGAMVEHALDGNETAAVIAAVGRPVDPALLALLLPAYLAFQLGAWTLAAGADAPPAQFYVRRLERLLRSGHMVTMALRKPSGRSRVASSARSSPASS